MNQAWPAADSTELDGWLVRRNAGVTLRANSVLPSKAPSDLNRALDYVENLYAAHAITPSFQISPVAQPATLDAHLATRGYTVRNPTLVQCAELSTVLGNLPDLSTPVNISTLPSDSWTDFWWHTDGHGSNATAKATAHQTLTQTQALYAAIPHHPAPPHVGADSFSPERLKAIGRLALVDDSAGLYCLAVDENFRRQGLAQAVIAGLLRQATKQGIRWVWLSVLEDNRPALELYHRLGFQTVSRYHYRVKPLP